MISATLCAPVPIAAPAFRELRGLWGMERLRQTRETRPPRMSALARLPVFLALEGKRAVVAGGTPAAAWKAELLSAAGANVDVHAIDICDEVLQLVADPPRGTITIHRHAWAPGDF